MNNNLKITLEIIDKLSSLDITKKRICKMANLTKDKYYSLRIGNTHYVHKISNEELKIFIANVESFNIDIKDIIDKVKNDI